MISATRVGILAGLLMAAAAWQHFGLSHGRPVPLHRSLQEFPVELGDWHGTPLHLDAQVVKVLGVETYLNRTYRREKTSAALYIGYYETQRQGDTIHSPKNCLPGAGWNIVAADAARLPLRPGEPGPRINKYIVQNGADRQMVFYWYQCRGRVITNDYLSRLYLVIDAVTKYRTDGSIIRISLPIYGESDGAEAEALRQGLDLTRRVFAELPKFIPG